MTDDLLKRATEEAARLERTTAAVLKNLEAARTRKRDAVSAERERCARIVVTWQPHVERPPAPHETLLGLALREIVASIRSGE